MVLPAFQQAQFFTPAATTERYRRLAAQVAFAAVLLARDLGSAAPDVERQFEFAVTRRDPSIGTQSSTPRTDCCRVSHLSQLPHRSGQHGPEFTRRGARVGNSLPTSGSLTRFSGHGGCADHAAVAALV